TFNLNWKEKQNLKEEIEKGTSMKFAVDNDANVAALGERWKGAGENDDEVTFVTLGTGVGGGVITNGEMVHGAGAGGEIGHINVQPNGYLCTCGNHGCLERSEEHTSELQSRFDLVCRLLLEKKTVYNFSSSP